MDSDGKTSISSNLKSNRTTNNSSSAATKPVGTNSSSAACPTKPHGKSVASSATALKPSEESAASTVVSTRRPGKAPVSSMNNPPPMVFRDVSLGPNVADLVFRLIHLWEARNPHTKTLIGEEMILIDEHGFVIQGFIPAGRVETFLPLMKAGSVYRLRNFYGSRSKDIYRVVDHHVTVSSFSWNSVLTVLDDCPVQIPNDHFSFHSYEQFEANCDLKGDLHDYVGHMRLVNGQAITDHPTLDESSIARTRYLMVHVQTHDEPVLKLYLWDKAATDFCQKYKAYESTPTVLLVTTVNPKRIGGTLSITSMSSSRVFMDNDVQQTRDYLSWLRSNAEVANQVKPEVVTKPETVTIGELLSYIKDESAKVAWFECSATIDDALAGTPWYYIACSGCNTKATKEPTSLICNNPKCERQVVEGMPQYLTKISVYDKSDQAMFALVGEAGRQLTEKYASELVASYFQANEDIGADQSVPVPQALLDTIVQTRKFIVKVSNNNFTGKVQSITVTKVLPLQAPEETATAPKSAEILEPGTEECGPSMGIGYSSGEGMKRSTDSVEVEAVKRPKSG